MVLICPHCASRSRIDDAHGQKPMAQVQCGSCGKRFYVSAAFRDSTPNAGSTNAPNAVAAALLKRRGTRPMGQGAWHHKVQPVLALVVPLGLLAACLWHVRHVSMTPEALSAQVQVAQGAQGGPVLDQVRVQPYAPAGGNEGLLVRGSVTNPGAKALTFSPIVVAQASQEGRAAPIVARMCVGAQQTLENASSLEPMGPKQTAQPVALEPGQKLPFVGLVALPGAQAPGPWLVRVGWLGAQKSAAQLP